MTWIQEECLLGKGNSKCKGSKHSKGKILVRESCRKGQCGPSPWDKRSRRGNRQQPDHAAPQTRVGIQSFILGVMGHYKGIFSRTWYDLKESLSLLGGGQIIRDKDRNRTRTLVAVQARRDDGSSKQQ